MERLPLSRSFGVNRVYQPDSESRARRNSDLLRWRWRGWWRRRSRRCQWRWRGRCLRNLDGSLRRIILFFRHFALMLYRGRRWWRRRRSWSLRFDRRRWGNLQVVYDLLHTRFAGRIAGGRVPLSIRVHLSGERNATLVGLHHQLLALKTGIAVQFVLDISGNLGVRRSLGAADRGHQDTEQNHPHEVERKPRLHNVTPADVILM